MRLPRALEDRLAPARERVEAFLKGFEWTWTTAVLASVAIWFYLLIAAVVIPSFWMYFAEQTLGWGGPTDIEAAIKDLPWGKEVALQVRDAIAMGLTVGPLVTLAVVAVVLQNWRRKLRGQTGDVRPTGGYR
jgi:cobalamin synthase